MCFNHTPAKTLSPQQQQLLVDLENCPISLIGNSGESINVNMNDIHLGFITNVIVKHDKVSLYSNEYWTDLRNRLNAYQHEIQELKDAQTNVNEDYVNTLSMINNIMEKLNNGTLQEPHDNEHSLCSYSLDDKTIYIYLDTINDLANEINIDPSYIIAYVYVYEMIQAFYHQMAGGGYGNNIPEIEESMIACGMLYYLKNAAEKTQRDDFKKIYKIACDNVLAYKEDSLTAHGFGYYLHEMPNASQILGEYAQKSKLIDHLSFNVIRYSVELIQGYPASSSMPHEGERLLLDLLVHQILNVGQHQELSFVHLYEQMKTELKKSLLEQWQPKGTKFDPNYQSQLEQIIDKTVSENVLVENMSPWQGATPIYKGGTDYTQIINSNMLKFLPYEHQVKCWDALRSPNTKYKSMVVTTGTGSGKTESFMVPLISDLADPRNHNTPGSLKAIFLYPLNALMEDQKSKLNELIERSGAGLTFAVYNGSSPNWEFDQRVMDRYSHEVVYREEIRGTHHWDFINSQCVEGGGRVPDIILTNPTMLEYMLLRKADEPIVSSSQKCLSWIVIDETHTYNGAGADELAMLVRRVLKAFDRNSSDVHFATSSATVGDNDDDLLKFIKGITGQGDIQINGQNTPLIKIIKGHRSTPDFSLTTIDRKVKHSLIAKMRENDFVYLRDLIPYKQDVIERLEELDRLCQGGLKAKIHFYVEALTNGIYANMEDIMNGAQQFNLVTEIPFDTNTCKLDSRYVGVVHCEDCGAILANCSVDRNDKYFRNPFASGGRNVAIFNNGITPQPNAVPCDVAAGNKIITNQNGNHSALLSPDFSCPCCGSKEIKSFNVSSASCMRSIAPVLLDNASAYKGNHPYYGRQFISFADSRRGAAQPSLKQNLITEEYWVISTLLRKLTKFDYEEIKTFLQNKQNEADNVEYDRLASELKELRNANQNHNDSLIREIAERNGMRKNVISWEEALDELLKDDNCPNLAACFAKGEDWDSKNGKLKDEYLKKYVLGALYNVMKKRSKDGFSAESYGIFRTYYPQLEGLTKPQEVDALNVELAALGKDQIKDKDWQDYLKIYLDFNVRTNERLFFMRTVANNKWDCLDIDNCRNLKTTYGLRRSIKDPVIIDNKPPFHYKLLWRLFGCDNDKQLAALNPNLPTLVENVVKAMWDVLKQNQIVVKGQRYYQAYNENSPKWHGDKLSSEDIKKHFTEYRLNLADISFCLFDDAFREENVKAILDTTFMGYSPYQEDYKKNPVLPVQILNWNPPYPSDTNTLKSYYNNNHVPYLLCRKTENLYSQKPIFIQYEHTAQVHRDMAKQRITKFKEHDINILACSTTMEMGVDIGELEIVTMSNIPPHPANYKQRAGRGGRAFQNKSTCVTICNSDAVGTAVLKEPKEALLEREVMTPCADLNSPQVVQRHINSFLLREYFVQPVAGNNAPQNIKAFKVLDFFLDAQFHVESINSRKNLCYNNTPIFPNSYDPITFHAHSFYDDFSNWLLHLNATNTKIWTDLDLLKSGTDLSGVSNQDLISSTSRAIGELFSHLSHSLIQIKTTAVDPNLNLNWTVGRLSKYERRLNYDFITILNQNLLEYSSTHQFTPNANMPVNIVELKIRNDSNSFDNPSRDLVVALSEYAPGKSITIDGKSYTIGGVDWDRGKKTFSRVNICTNCGYTWDSLIETDCPLCNYNTNIRRHNMIEPTAFLPEQETDRIVDKDTENVSLDAQLIGADGLHLQFLTPMCDYDVELPQANTKIMYLNKGAGFGYCVCKQDFCGRAVLESQLEKSGDTQYLRDLMYTRVERENKNINPPQTIVTYEHQNLNKFDQQDIFNTSELLRNMFIGGSILTNFSILKPYHCSHPGNGRIPFRMSNITDESILTTLGIIVCEELSNYIPCQRQDIDFLTTTFNRGERALCIYDTAKGGAGYSSKLDSNMWKIMLARCHKRLDDIVNGRKGIDSILTRSTMRYLEDIDIRATYDWLEEEMASRNVIPTDISSVYPTAVRSSLVEIEKGLNQAHSATLFVQPDINTWNYELDKAAVPSWKETRRSFKLKGNIKTELAFCGDPGTIPAEASDIIKHSEDWATFVKADFVKNGIYPLAYVNGWLYITNDADTANYNGLWANGEIFAVQTQKPTVTAFAPTLTGFNEFFIKTGTTLNSSKGLLDLIIHLDNSRTIKKFIDNSHGHHLEFQYMDEHLKTQLGTIMAIQAIEAFVSKIGCDVSEFKVSFINEQFNDNFGLTYKDSYRKLTDSFKSDADCKAMMDDLLVNTGWNYSVYTKPRKSLPHWRSLTIKDLTNNSILTIKPHGGIANGWFIDTARTRFQGKFFKADNSNAGSDIPLVSDSTNQIQYTISLQ